MTLRNTTLTAVAALTVALAGGVMAQDNSTAPGVTAPAGSSYHSGAAAPEAEAAPEAASTESAPEAEAETAPEAEAAPAAAEESAVEEPAAEAPVAEPEAEEPAAEAEAAAPEAEAEAPAAEEAPAETDAAPAAEEAPAEEAAAAEDEAAPAAEGEHAAEEGDLHAAAHIEDISFSFEGPFGKFDQFQLQRGLQVYTEVCAACHGLRYVPIRTLSDPNGVGLPEDQVKAYAANLNPIIDAETGEERPRVVTDHFPTIPHADGMGPDLSLMAKARAGFHGPYGTGLSQLVNGIGGPEYIHAVLVGYDGETKEEAGTTLYHNAAFAGNWIQMPQPLMDDQVTYEDGTPATVDQMAQDVAAFLMWTAEPKLMDRKQVGLVSVLFLIVLSALLYLTNKRLWWPIKHRDETH
ncbi:cytochrome c1 [Paracoccus sp. DMF-8]|uniref:cytochrome c1 n=1 Tax=Paracoccus sp. DMF-8 TaxID=3019445 RepID=UPI0032048F28